MTTYFSKVKIQRILNPSQVFHSINFSIKLWLSKCSKWKTKKSVLKKRNQKIIRLATAIRSVGMRDYRKIKTNLNLKQGTQTIIVILIELRLNTWEVFVRKLRNNFTINKLKINKKKWRRKTDNKNNKNLFVRECQKANESLNCFTCSTKLIGINLKINFTLLTGGGSIDGKIL